MACVVAHHDRGLFIGVVNGTALWSRKDPAGNFDVSTFTDIEQARKFVSSAFATPQNPDDYSFITVHDGSIKSLLDAGIPEEMTRLLLYCAPVPHSRPQ